MEDKKEISEIDAHLIAQKITKWDRLIGEIKRKKALLNNYLLAMLKKNMTL